MQDIFDRIIADKDAFFKHQKMEEDELTEDEKLSILKNLSEEKLSVFLTRYQKYLKPSDCDKFAGNNDVVVQEILKQVRGHKEVSEIEFQKRNWRFNTMQQLLKEGVFFSDAKMREREPYLYDAMIGKFQTPEERMEHLRPTVSRDQSECTWSSLLDRLEDSTEIAERRNLQEMEWEGPRKDDGGRDHIGRFMAHVANQTDDFVPEEEEDEEEDEIEQMRKEMERLARMEAEQYEELGEDDTPQLLRHEFEAFIQQKFLAGRDEEFFDYSKCQVCASNDSIRERDEEEKWFDEDE